MNPTEEQTLVEQFKTHQLNDSLAFAEAAREREDIKETVKAILGKLDAIDKKIDPIAIDYQLAGRFGKWVMTVLLAISLLVGIVYGIVRIITNKP